MTAIATAASVTGSVALIVAGIVDLVAAVTAVSATPDTTSLITGRAMAAAAMADSATTIIPLLRQMSLSAQAVGVSVVDGGSLVVTRPFASSIVGQSVVPDIDLTVAVILGVLSLSWTARSPFVSCIVFQPGVAWATRQPSIVIVER
ncbi:MAG: hypothetical protein IPK53_03650 [bacterium]|nr:hypothetical protein [bacterium]